MLTIRIVQLKISESQIRMSSPKVTVVEGSNDNVAFISIERTGSLARSQRVGKNNVDV